MFGNSMFGVFDNDPFFSAHQQRMNQMMQSSFGMMMPGAGGAQLAVQGGPPQGHPQAQHGARPHPHAHSQQVARQRAAPFGGMNSFFGGGMFPDMDNMMMNMRQQMSSAQNAPGGQFFSHSSVMSYSSDGQGAPKVYQATSSTTQAPGGVRETKRTVRDSEAALEKMSVGRYIQERGHVQEKARNTRTGDTEENEELHNLDEEEKQQFHSEFRQRTQQFDHDRRVRGERSYHDQRALGDGRPRYSHHSGHPQRPAPYHTAPPSLAIQYRERD